MEYSVVYILSILIKNIDIIWASITGEISVGVHFIVGTVRTSMPIVFCCN